MAAYRADIQIGVSGQRELERLRSAITQTSAAAESLNRIRVNGGRLAQSLENYNTQLERAQRNLRVVATASAAENKAITEYVTALGSANAARARQNDLINDEIRLQQTAARVARLAAAGIRETSGTTQLGPGPASPVGSLVGQKSAVEDIIRRTLQGKQDEVELQAALLRLEEKSAAALNEKIELQQRLNRTALEQGKTDVQRVSAQQAQRQQFLAGNSGTAMQGPLAGPGAMGFPVALSLSRVEQQALEATSKKQEILQRMVNTRQTLVGLADNLRRIDQNAANQIKVALADADRLNAAKLKQLQITEQIRASEATASNAARQRLAQEATRRNRIRDAGFGIQGPALPPVKTPVDTGVRSSRLGGAVSGSIIGGSFPLLFGQGAGAAAGGAVGGLLGGLAGPGGSFAGSLLGTLIGDIASQGAKIKELATDIGFSADETERLEKAFALAGQEADKFAAATQNIRGLGLSIDDQADAITLAANLTEAYGGKIDKVAAAYANFVEKGKVGITDINKFTSEGIPILDELERKYNTNRDGILKLAKDGEISAQALSDALIAIGNSSDTAVKKTVTGWDKAWADIKAGGSLLGQAISAYFSALVGSAGSSTSSIAESFGAMFKNIVQNSIDATAALARSLANLARFAANISATAELGGLNIGATVSKNIAKNTETTARNLDIALQKIQLPEPGKVGAITIPGQAPPSGAGAKDKGADTAEQRAKALLALSKEYLADQLKLIELNVRQVELFVGTEAALTRQLELTQTVGRIRTESLELEREEALMEAAKLGTTGAVVKLYTQKFKLLQNELNIEQKVTEQKLAQTKLERQLRLDTLQRDKQEAIRNLKVQQNTVGLDIAAFTVDPKRVERARQQLDQINRAYEAEVPILTEIDNLQRQIQSGAYSEEDLAIKNQELALQQSKLNGIREELTLLDSLEQRQLRLQQFYQTYGQLIQSVSGEIANAVTFGVSEMIRGTKTAEEVFSQFLNAVGEALLSAAQQMIASYIAIGIAKMFAGFGGGGGLGSSASNVAAYAPLAKGGTFGNGVAAFAKGGAFSNSIVSSPTLFKFADGGTTRTGLMGEAGPEAIMPLKRGSDGSLGVQATGLREAMGRPPGGANGSTVLNMSFQSTNINGVEYVSRDQLEAAMAQTRRQAAKDGANRGMTMTLDKIQNSPSTRSRVGIR